MTDNKKIPKVSIVCLTYNQATFVDQTVRSLCLQTYPSLEVVVSDDGSTDGTQQVIAGLAAEFGSRLVPLSVPSNTGIAKNTNRAIAACTGDLVAFCGGDDLFLPRKIAKQVEFFERHPGAALCAHDVEYFDGRTGATTGRHSQLLIPRHSRGPAELLRRGNIFHAISVMVRRTSLPSYHADERVPVANDYKLWIDCLAGDREYGYLPEVLARYRIGVSNITRHRPKQIWAESFLSLGIAEGEFPELTDECRAGRARLLLSRALEHMRNEPTEARQWLKRSLGHSLWSQRSWPFWLALTFAPAQVRRRLFDRLLDRSPLAQQVDDEP
jgi:glycosyltransferase involved in cell wall biosynthesis